MPIDFDKQEYWHRRFATETQFEWLVPSSTFMAIIEPHLDSLLSNYHSHDYNSDSSADEPLATAPKVLQIGFGTSDLQNHLRARGLPDVLNIDYEPLAIERGRQLEKQTFGDVVMKYAVMDATELSSPPADFDFPSSPNVPRSQFDLVLDKSTVDAVSCGGQGAFLRMAGAVRRCLAPGGVWISLSYSSARFDVEDEGGRGLPFEVDVLAKIPTPKARATDPDIYYWCYLLTPK